jgi:hypothetical protein
MGMEVCSWTKKVRVFVFGCCYRKEEGVAGGCLMEWDGIKSNQIKSNQDHTISAQKNLLKRVLPHPWFVIHIVIC